MGPGQDTLRGPLRVTRADAVRIAVSGFVLNGVQFGAMYLAFDAGLGATLASLMHSLSPVPTAVLAAAFLGERLSRLQVLGFVIGVAGVLLVLGPDVEEAGGTVGLVCGVVSVLGLSIGTLGQRWIGHAPDPCGPGRSSSGWQRRPCWCSRSSWRAPTS